MPHIKQHAFAIQHSQQSFPSLEKLSLNMVPDGGRRSTLTRLADVSSKESHVVRDSCCVIQDFCAIVTFYTYFFYIALVTPHMKLKKGSTELTIHNPHSAWLPDQYPRPNTF